MLEPAFRRYGLVAPGAGHYGATPALDVDTGDVCVNSALAEAAHGLREHERARRIHLIDAPHVDDQVPAYLGDLLDLPAEAIRGSKKQGPLDVDDADGRA